MLNKINTRNKRHMAVLAAYLRDSESLEEQIDFVVYSRECGYTIWIDTRQDVLVLTKKSGKHDVPVDSFRFINRFFLIYDPILTNFFFKNYLTR